MTGAPAAQAAAVEPRTRESGGSLAHNALHLVLGQAGTMVLGILFSSLLGRSLGAGDFGLYFLINSLAAFSLVLVDWGQNYFGIREVARAPARGGELLGTGLVLRAVGTLLIALPAALVAWGLGYDRRTIVFSVVFLLLNIPLFLAQNFGMVFRGRDRMGLDASVSVLNRAAGLVLAFLALRVGWGLWGVMVAQGLAGAVALLLAFRLYSDVSQTPLTFRKETAREILVGGTAIVAITIAVYVQPYLDAVLLSKMVPKDALGWYGAAKSIMGTLLAPSLILGAAAYPRLSRVADDRAQFRTEFAIAQRPMLWLGGLAAVGTWLFAEVAIHVVYGQRQFGPAAVILQVFGLGLFLIFVDVLVGTALTALGRATAFAVAKIASVALALGLELVLIPWFQYRTGNGGIGVTVAAVISEVVIFAGGLMLMPRGTLSGAVFVDGFRALCCGLATWALFQVLPPLPPWLGIPFCIAAYAALSSAVGLLRREDVRMLASLLRRNQVGGS